jgi:hypothetical protein
VNGRLAIIGAGRPGMPMVLMPGRIAADCLHADLAHSAIAATG